MSEIIKSACNCGEEINIEIGLVKSFRGDGKRPFYDGEHPLVTQLRCRKCNSWLANSCPGAIYGNNYANH